jgi:hypothetical protein
MIAGTKVDSEEESAMIAAQYLRSQEIVEDQGLQAIQIRIGTQNCATF